MTEEKMPVFRVVEGQLVRVPGDIRDPKRRYSSVSDVKTGKSYLREFTEEEERQRDAEEKTWEAERPQREAEAKRREEEAQRFRESLRYESRVVALLDVLGWSQAIAASVDSLEITQRLGIAMQGLGAHVKMNTWQREHGGPGGWPGDPMITHFSDSLLISFAADHHAKSSLEMTLSAVIDGMLFNGFVVRGAVCCGQLIHRDFLAYGPALITAYELEKDVAKVPRIILDPSIAEAWGQGVRIENRDGSLIGYHKVWRRDDDGWFFFDYLSDRFKMPGTESEEPNRTFQVFMGKWRQLILQRLEENAERPPVRAKYVWLAHYFNKICAENPRDGLDPIYVQ
jgi:hypothetical protein